MIRARCLAALGTLVLAACASSPQSSSGGTDAAEAELYVLAGQSNMSGLGRLGSLTADERTADPSIRLYGNDGRWKPALDPLDDATDQIDGVSADRKPGVGPGLFFARKMRGQDRAPIDLVPCAKGGSAIDQWAAGGGRDTLYGSCLARIAEAGGRPAGMIWYQGEADARTMDLASTWQAKFTAMVAAMRRELGQPDLPIVLVELSDPDPARAARQPGWRTVQAAQRTLELDCAATVSAVGLPQNPDRLHIATEGQRILGDKLATAMADLQSRGCTG